MDKLKKWFKAWLKLGFVGMLVGIFAFLLAMYLIFRILFSVGGNFLGWTSSWLGGTNTTTTNVGVAANPWLALVNLKEVQGDDIACVGKIPGFKRIFFSRDDYSTQVYYAVEGDKFEYAKNYVKDKLTSCNYKEQESESSEFGMGIGQVKIDKGVGTTFVNSYEGSSVDVGVFLVEYNGKKYTVVILEKEVKSQDSASETPPGSSQETTPTQNTSGASSSEYDSAQSVQIADSNLEKAVRPLLQIVESVVGKVKITDYAVLGQVYSVQLVHKSDKPLAQLLEAIKQKAAQSGFAVVTYSLSKDEGAVMLQKDGLQYILSLGDDKTATLTVVKQQ